MFQGGPIAASNLTHVLLERLGCASVVLVGQIATRLSGSEGSIDIFYSSMRCEGLELFFQTLKSFEFQNLLIPLYCL